MPGEDYPSEASNSDEIPGQGRLFPTDPVFSRMDKIAENSALKDSIINESAPNAAKELDEEKSRVADELERARYDSVIIEVKQRTLDQMKEVIRNRNKYR